MSEEVVSEEETKPQGHQDDAAGQNPAEQQQVKFQDSEMNAPFNKDDDETIPEYTALFTLQGHKRSVSSLCISPDGQQLASSGADGLLKVWSMATGTLIVTLDAALAKVMDVVVEEDEEQDRSHLKLGICDVAWSKDGRYLVSGGDDCMVRVWDVGKILARQFVGHTSYVFCVNFHPDVSLAVSGSFDETVRLWNLQRNTCHRIIPAHSEAVTAVDFNIDGSILASSSSDGLIRLWDSSTGQCLKTLVHGDAQAIGHITFSPNSFQLLVSSLDHTIRLWDISNSRVVKTYLGHQNEKYAIKACFSAYVPSSSSFSSSPSSSSASSSSPQHHGTKGMEPIITSPSITPPLMIVAGSEDNRIYLWDMQTRKVIQTLVAHKDAVTAIATHPSMHVIASASLDRDCTIKIWSLKNKRAIV